MSNYVIYKSKRILNYISGFMTLFIPFLLPQRYHSMRAANIFALIIRRAATDDYDRIKHSLYLNH